MIRDGTVFDDDHLPREIVGRNSHMTEVTTALAPIERGEQAENCFLFGPSGAGKTTVARAAVRELRREVLDVPYAYVNCWQNYTKNAVLECLAQELVDAAVGLARDSGTVDPGAGKIDRSDRYWWVLELQRQFPDDPGILAPLYLNLIHLRPGEAAFLDAGILHAYLYGAGVEIMANSDNVLRAGCTAKHVDVTELGRVLTFGGDTSLPIRPERGDAVFTYTTPAVEFELQRVDLSIAPRVELLRNRGEVVVLAVGATVELTDPDGSVQIGTGESAFLDGAAGVDRRSGADSTGFRGRGGAGAPAGHRVRIETAEQTPDSAVMKEMVHGAYLFIASLPGAVEVTVSERAG
ncbi:MAG: AAA family ATPase [Alkalispirochaeta sp.]